MVFITLDGPGAVGKSTARDTTTAALRAAGHAVHPTTEPSTGLIGTFTRANANEIHGHALALLVASDRRHHLAVEVGPALAQGNTVLCDRYLPSSLVLQRLDGVPLDFILAINAGVTLPDLAVLLTAAPDLILRRLASRGAHHRFELDAADTVREVELYAEAVPVLN
ncbi:dTMP kinase, partial [Kitasatospora nipponensis]|uniref:dTMP kinase n=1 Tax=Kitasatospora nipponensis TaxID=258049 RepID=UPI0031DCEA11